MIYRFYILNIKKIYRIYIDFATIKAPVQAFWKLKPPVTASILRTSPAK